MAVEALIGEGTVRGVRLTGGEFVSDDLVVVGIIPAVEPLLTAGAVGGYGVWVDAQCRTSLPDIFAVGNCTLHANAFADGIDVRLKSVQNATDQANVAARAIRGEDATYTTLPWFWPNQYDLKLQTIGLALGLARCRPRA